MGTLPDGLKEWCKGWLEDGVKDSLPDRPGINHQIEQGL